MTTIVLVGELTFAIKSIWHGLFQFAVHRHGPIFFRFSKYSSAFAKIFCPYAPLLLFQLVDLGLWLTGFSKNSFVELTCSLLTLRCCSYSTNIVFCERSFVEDLRSFVEDLISSEEFCESASKTSSI